MREISDIINNPVSGAKSSTDIYAKVRSDQLTVEQKQAIKYFFARLQRVYQAEYRRQIPDESTERAIKAEFGDRVMNIPKTLMDKGFDNLHNELSSVDSEYRFMRLDSVIELIKTGGNVHGVQDGAHKVLPRALPPSKEYIAKRKRVGLEGCAKILSIFDEGED